MKRAIAFVCIAFLLLFSSAVIAEETNLLSNGGFEEVSSSGGPSDWYLSAYRTQAGYSRLGVTDEKAHSGQYSAVIENASANDARYTCTVKVNPESLYRLSGYVLVESMEDTGNGANFGIEGIYSFSDGLFDTGGEWRYLEWYGETGENQTEVTIGVRVGGYSAESTGKAYFDDIVLEEVDSLPEDVIASLWYNAYAGVQAQQDAEEEEITQKSTAWFVVCGFIFLLLFALLLPNMNRRSDHRFTVAAFAALCALALLLRVALAMNVEGYEVDINCFRAWSMRMASVGPLGFYTPDYFCDYPPGAMLLLWPIGFLLNATGLSNEGLTLLIVKLIPILADLMGAAVLFCCTLKRLNSGTAIAASVLYLFNPAVLVNGAAWGQMDSVLTLFLLLTALAAMEKNWRIAIPLFIVSALVKPQALLFAPVGGMAWLCHLADVQKSERKSVLIQSTIGLGIGAAVALAVVVPFAIRQPNPWTWIFELYAETLQSYAYVTLNTANLYYLFGANWTALTQSAPVILLGLAGAAFAAMGMALCVRRTASLLCSNAVKRKTVAALMLAMAGVMLFMLIFGVSYGTLGLAMMAFAYLLPIICLCSDSRRGSLPYWMSLALICIYVLGIKVHERYLFPALMLMLLAYVDTRDRRILAVFAGFSITTFINTAIVLDNSILFGAAQGHLNPDTLVLNQILCVLNLLLCGYAALIGVNGIRESKAVECSQKGMHVEGDRLYGYRRLLLAPRDARLHLKLRDYLIMAAVTAAYAVLAFANLGSTVAPQTAWISTADDENIVLELDESATFSVLYYAGVSYNDFAISVSEDGVNWSQSYPCEMRQGLCYRWNYALKTNVTDNAVSYPDTNPDNVLWVTGKYLRVEAVDAGLNLWEVVARDQNGNNLPLRLAAHNNAQPQMLSENMPAAHLIDEQETCVGEPGWYNGTYFDEIYHARTAYEHLHGQAPYETTHPPLGKLMMSAAIAVFGMTPFGWRFAGALIGVLMLPALYLLGMQLTHKRSVAVVSMMAFALDLMHFTQTRIATIDSFPVFFILLTYLFMIRYLQMDSFAVSNSKAPRLMDRAYLKTLVPLLLCGICMGLSIASKWIGIYSAVGLAILFFAAMYRNIRVWQTAWDAEMDDRNPRVQAARSFTIHRIAITCGFCVLFFVLIPCLIYAASYIPYLSPTGPVTLKRIIKAQEGMLSYHSTPGLGMDHPFQSPWWQWPFILKPMWFAQDKFEPTGYASTILCFGNPWVFYIGAFAMVFVLMASIGRFIRLRDRRLVLVHGNGDWALAILAVAFLAQYLPWVLVPRSMYMYHYFASVPFIILATALLMERFTRSKPPVRTVVMLLYIAGAAVFFIMFFPYASGYLTSTKWLDAMKWFSKLYY